MGFSLFKVLTTDNRFINYIWKKKFNQFGGFVSPNRNQTASDPPHW